MTGWWRSHSVRVRLTLWYVFAMLLVLAVYAAAVFSFISRGLSDGLNQQLRQDFVWVFASVYQTADEAFTLDEPEPIVPEEGLPAILVWSTDGRTLLYSNPEAQRRPLLQAPPSREGIATIPADQAPMRVLTRRVDFLMRQGSVRDAHVIIQVARSEATMRAQLHELVLLFVFGLPAAAAVAGLGGYALAKRALTPVERMTERAQTITAERLHDRLPVDNPDDEMGRLATVFNETLGRLEASFEQMRRFTADVSHELRTPLTAIRSVGEVGLRGHRDDSAYRAIIGSMLEEVDRLASLVDRLLTLSRAETGQAKVNLETIDLVRLSEDVAAHLSVLAEEKNQIVTVAAHGVPVAMADRLVVRQALINLVDNAIKFSPPSSRVVVTLGDTGRVVTIDVADSGPGIPEEARELVFDRFYRSTAATDTTGSGLGLSIARGAVEATGGTLSLLTSSPKGSTFRITLPRAVPQPVPSRPASSKPVSSKPLSAKPGVRQEAN